VATRWRDFPRIGEIHNGDLEEVQNARVLVDVYTHGYKLEEDRCFQVGAMDPTLYTVDRLSHVSGQHRPDICFL
jgi:hypothetical protein